MLANLQSPNINRIIQLFYFSCILKCKSIFILNTNTFQGKYNYNASRIENVYFCPFALYPHAYR